ncbi:unnamed protein product, partial [Brassica rapa subsp. trilocularis]
PPPSAPAPFNRTTRPCFRTLDIHESLTKISNAVVEAPWPSGQGLKASTPRSGVQTPGNAISTGRGLGFNSRRRRIMQKN